MILTGISFALGLAYIPLLAGATIVSASRKASLRRLTIGLRLLVLAASVEGLKLIVNLSALPKSKDQAVLSAICLTIVAAMIAGNIKRRRLKGDQVVAEAEKTVRDWDPLERGTR